MARRVLTFLIAIVLLAAPRAALAQSSRVLVMPFAVEVSPDAPGGAGTAFWLGEASALLLEEQLARRGIGTLTRDERVAGFDRLQLPMSPALTRATMIRAAELMGASHVLFGDVRLGQTLGVRARVVDLAAGQERLPASDSAPLAEIFTLFRRVADRVAETAALRPLPASPSDLSPLSLEAFENYVKGLVAATPAAQQRFLETALRLAPGDPRVLLALWNVYTVQELHEKALAVANAVPATSSFGRKARFGVALSLVALKRLDGAYQELSTLAAQRGSAAIANALGIVQLRRGAPAGSTPASAYFKRAVDQESDNTAYLFNLGYAFALAGNATEALAWLREAVRFDAADGDAHVVMSAVLAANGRQAEAQRELELARVLGATEPVAAGPPSPRIPRNLERLIDQLDVKPSRAVAAAAPAQRDQQETAAFLLARAKTLIAQKDDRRAMAELRRAIYLAPYQDEPHLLLGQLYRRAGQVSDAIDEFKVAVWARESAEAHVALGEALFDAGEKEAARKAADRALVLSPGSAAARALLERIGG
ncbi:MAG: tetratricopeptide repeat protein [Acidobacteria bacterium]|nr:tetratricopeptide repeat protein [Acidobacteriota bacterium]